MKTLARALLILIAVGACASAAVAYSIVRQGLSTRVPPSALEKVLARAMRYAATPADIRAAQNPVEPTQDVFEEGLEHFADHCASCHANDGSGETELGRSFYPPAPDMRATSTQDLTDGELFSIIENGIRLTGMPAWGAGTDAGELGSWGLVHFVRRLPGLNEVNLSRMEEFNPKSPAQFREDEKIRRFLAREDLPASAKPAPGVSASQH